MIMKSMGNFTSSQVLKNLHDVRGGEGDPQYLGWSDTGNGADEELLTKNGTGDCSGWGVGPHDCVDDTYDCGGITASGVGSATASASGIAG